MDQDVEHILIRKKDALYTRTNGKGKQMKHWVNTSLIAIVFMAIVLFPNMNAWAGTITNVSATAGNKTIQVEGTTEDGVFAVVIAVYDDAENLVTYLTAGVNDSHTYTATLSVEYGSYTVKVADYAGGDFAQTNVTVVAPSQPQQPAHTHSYSKIVTPPTETEKGYTSYICSCGASYVDDYVDALGKTATVIINKDGSSKEITETVWKNEAGNEVIEETIVNISASGKVTGTVTTAIINQAAKNTAVTITIKKDENGAISETKATVDKIAEGTKATLSGSVVKQITEIAGTDTLITIKAKDKIGNILYTVKVNASKLKSNRKLYIYKKNQKTGVYTMVNAKEYIVSEKGTVSVNMKEKATYELVSASESKSINKQILSTVSLKEEKTSLKRGASISIQFHKDLNRKNVKNITYTVDNTKLAKVSKTGKITAKKTGDVIVKVKVTLKNKKIKTLKLKISIK